MTITTTNALPAPVQQWFDNVLLSRPMPKLIHKQMALKKELPPNSGRIARYRRYTNLATATVNKLEASAVVKSSLIDLEALWGDRAQAKAA